jgi:hypothetical protein
LTADAFAPRLTIRTCVGLASLARLGDLGTQRLATALGLVSLADVQAQILGSDAVGLDFLDQFLHQTGLGFVSLLFSLGLQLGALSFELLYLGVEVFKRNDGHFAGPDGLV